MTLLTDIDDVKKRLAKLEEETKYKMKQMEESFALFRDVVIQMQREKSELEKRNLLLEKENLLLKKHKKPITQPLESVADKIGEKVKPIKAEFDDTVNLFKQALEEDEKEDIGYIEIAEPTKAEEKPVESSGVEEDAKKKKILSWFREKYGIALSKEKPAQKQSAAKHGKKKNKRFVAS